MSDVLELCDISDLETYPGLDKLTPSDKTWLTRLIRGFTIRAEHYCSREFYTMERTRQFTTQDNCEVIHLPAYGRSTDAVAEVRQDLSRDFTPDTTLVDAGQYYFNPETGELISTLGRWLGGHGVVRVKWTGGLGVGIVDVPDDLRMAACLQVAAMWQRARDLTVASKSFGQGGSMTNFSRVELLPDVEEVLDNYRRT